MACLLKRGAVWTARIYTDGKEVWRSLGTGDRQLAERKAREIEGGLKGRRWIRRELDQILDRAKRETQADEVGLLCDTLVAALVQFVNLAPEEKRESLATELSRRLTDLRQRKLAISGGWDAWERSANRSTSAKSRTLAGYRAIWQQFAAWAEKRGVGTFHEFDEAAALAYADHLWAVPVSPRTFTAHVQFLRGLWTVVRVPAGLTAANPWASIRGKQAAPDSGRRDLTPAEVRAVIGAATGSMRLLLLSGAMTGARLGDVANMRWADLDLEAGTWSFTPMKTSRTGKRLVLPLLSPLLEELRAARGTSLTTHVFKEERPLWSRGDLTKRISAHFESCGIVTNEAVSDGQQRRRARIVVGFHSLRHSAATAAAKAGTNLALVQKTLGHSTAGMTAHYTHGDLASARQVLAPLAEIVAIPAQQGKGVAA